MRAHRMVLLLALGVLGAAVAGPASAQWAVQRLDQYGTVTTDWRAAEFVEAYTDGAAGWRLRVACGPDARFALMLGRRNLFEPPSGNSIALAVTVLGRAGDVLFSGHVPMQWTRGSYGGAMPAALAGALAQGERVEIAAPRITDRFGLSGSSPALSVLRPCQVPRAQAEPAKPPSSSSVSSASSAWRYADGGGVYATAGIRMPGDRSIAFYCNRPDEARFRAWARRTPDANHVPFVPDRFQMDFSMDFWPEFAQQSPEYDEERHLTLELGARQLQGAVTYAGPESYFYAPVLFDSPLLRVLAEAEQAGERLIIREGTRVLAAVPLQGATEAIDRARAFCSAGRK